MNTKSENNEKKSIFNLPKTKICQDPRVIHILMFKSALNEYFNEDKWRDAAVERVLYWTVAKHLFAKTILNENVEIKLFGN